MCYNALSPIEDSGADVVFPVSLYGITSFSERFYPVGRFYRITIFVERIVFDMERVERVGTAKLRVSPVR